MNRWAWTGIALAASVALTAAMWAADIPGFFLFLFLPFLFIPFGRTGGPSHQARRCPACGRAYRDPDVAYCPRDGTRLP